MESGSSLSVGGCFKACAAASRAVDFHQLQCGLSRSACLTVPTQVASSQGNPSIKPCARKLRLFQPHPSSYLGSSRPQISLKLSSQLQLMQRGFLAETRLVVSPLLPHLG